MTLITSISSMFTEPTQRNSNLLNALDRTLKQYSDRLNNGKIKINSTVDLERIVRSYVMLTGQQTTTEPTETSNIQVPEDDPEIQELYSKLYKKYNQINDSE